MGQVTARRHIGKTLNVQFFVFLWMSLIFWNAVKLKNKSYDFFQSVATET